MKREEYTNSCRHCGRTWPSTTYEPTITVCEDCENVSKNSEKIDR